MRKKRMFFRSLLRAHGGVPSIWSWVLLSSANFFQRHTNCLLSKSDLLTVNIYMLDRDIWGCPDYSHFYFRICSFYVVCAWRYVRLNWCCESIRMIIFHMQFKCRIILQYYIVTHGMYIINFYHEKTFDVIKWIVGAVNQNGSYLLAQTMGWIEMKYLYLT